MKYSLIAEAYEKIEATTKRLEMTDLLVQLIKQTPKELVRKMAYLTQGKLYPNFLGIELGMAEKMTVQSIAKASELEKKEVMKHWRKIGDLGLTAEKLLEKKVTLKKFLTVNRVYDTLDKIAHTSGKGSVEKKINLLTDLLGDATLTEVRYLVRTITGRLRLGIGDMTFLDALAIAYIGDVKTRKLVEKAYNLSSDMGLVSQVLADNGVDGIRNFKIRIGRPIRPMLAGRMKSAEEILEKFGGQVSAEYKYDGLRVQGHLSQQNISLFSRKLENLTSQFPDVVNTLKLGVKAREAIIDGECVAVDPNTGEMQPFQVITQRRGRKHDIARIIEKIPVIFFPFDILYVDGVSLMETPYLERRRKLENVIIETDRLKLANKMVIYNPKQLDQYMDGAIEKGCEGLVLKSISKASIYRAGSRGFLWIKYKREYKSELADSVDLVAVGAFAGFGRRAGTYGALLMASYDKETDSFYTVCKLGSGFNDDTLSKFPEVFEPYIREKIHPRVNSRIKADYWFTPSLVMEVIGSELTISPLHTCGLDFFKEGSGLAIRFPRFSGKLRKDKSLEDSTSVNEIIKMYKLQLKRIK